MKIGNVTLDNNLILAPMAGVTDLPFRLLCKEQGAGLLCTEMVSAKAIYYKNKKTLRTSIRCTRSFFIYKLEVREMYFPLTNIIVII